MTTYQSRLLSDAKVEARWARIWAFIMIAAIYLAVGAGLIYLGYLADRQRQAELNLLSCTEFLSDMEEAETF